MINQVRTKMKHQQIDCLWVCDLVSIEFLTGYKVEVGERFIGLCITDNSSTLILNHLFEYNGDPSIHVEYYYDFDDVSQIIKKHSLGEVIGVDKVMKAKDLMALIDRKIVIGSDCVDSVRCIKSDAEIQKMIAASQINDQVMSKVPSLLKIGVSEKEVADQIEKLFLEANAESLSFDTIVAFGDHGADPHAVPSDRRLKENENIIIDMGCRYQGYCSDMTRTFFLNNNPIKEIYDLVLEANLRAIESIQPGSRFCDVDKIARDIISSKGYGNNFTHRLGHGIGKEVHEPYDVSLSNQALIEPGMCFSIEPGIYIKDQLGIRIEDLIYINKEGRAVLLNHYPKDQELIIR